jgi:hypothetical protein
MHLLLVDAYSLGSGAGTVIRWAVLAVVAVSTIQRLRTGRYTPARAGITLAVVGALVAASAVYDLSGPDSAKAQVGAAEANVMAGCTASGAPRSYCACVWDRMEAAGLDTEAELGALSAASLPPQIRTAIQECAAAAG